MKLQISSRKGALITASPALNVLLALLLAMAVCAAVPATQAFASGNTSTNLAYNEDAENVEDQTMIGEGANNNLHIVNTTSSLVSPTGVNLGFASAAVVAAVACAIVALGASRIRRRDDLEGGGAL